MKIAIISTSGIYPIQMGGPGNVGYFLAKEFGTSGNDVTVFVRAKNKIQLNKILNMKEFTNLENVKFVPVQIEYNLRTFLNIPLVLIAIIKLSYLFFRENFDVVLYNSPPVDICFVIPFLASFKNIRQFIIFHGYGGLTNNKIGKFIIKSIKGKFNNCITVSNHSKSIPQSLGFSDEKIKIIYNGVNISENLNVSTSSLIGSPKILYVGALSKLKCVNVLIEAFSQLIKTYPDSLLFIVGDGREKSNLIQLANKLEVSDNVRFEGFINGNELKYYYNLCNLFVLPSRCEGMPLALLEAMSYGLPIIISDSDFGPKELIRNGANCFTFQCNDSNSLYHQIISLFDRMPDERESLIKSNIDYIKRNHSWELISKRYIELFRESTSPQVSR